MAVYDAGTESGQAFSLNNSATDPVDAVTLLNRDDPAEHDFVSGAGSDGKFIATLTFERIK